MMGRGKSALVLSVLVFLVASAAYAASATTLTFEGISAPSNRGPAKHHIKATGRVKATTAAAPANHAQRTRYQTLLRTGETLPCAQQPTTTTSSNSVRSIDPQDGGDGGTCIFGALTDDQNAFIPQRNALLRADLPGTIEISPHPDGQTVIQTNDDGKIYITTQFESPRPGAMYVTEVEQDPASGHLWPIVTRPVDWSSLGGLWIPCAAKASPWNTHIGGEEYEPDAKYYSKALYGNASAICGASAGVCTSISCDDDSGVDVTDFRTCEELRDAYQFSRYFSNATTDVETFEGFRAAFKPYMYGWPFEVRPGSSSGEVRKLFALGRRSNELAYVLPDRRTVYLTDDGSNGVMTMFRADKEGDLSSGNLYAAKFTIAKNGRDGAGASWRVDWIDLGHATEEEIEAAARNGTQFTDMFAIENLGSNNGTRQDCGPRFKSINAGAAGQECLRVKPGKEKLASRLETRRYASLLGATSEFAKLEGLTFEPTSGALIASVSSIKDGMMHGNPTYDVGGGDDFRMEYNPCGCVFALELDEEEGKATHMEPILCGRYENGGCSIDGIANPDNVAMAGQLLLIAEDSSYHENNFLWAFDIQSKNLTRILSAPLGSEVTSPNFVRIGRYGYVFATIQHPVSQSSISCAFLLRSLRPSTAPIPTSLPCDLVLTPTILATSVRKRHGRTHPARRVVHRPRRLRRIHWPRAHGSRELCAGVDCGWNGGGVQALNLVINNDTKPLLMHECKLYPDLYSPHHDAQQAAHQNKKPLIFFKDRMKEPLKVLWRHG